MKCPHCGKQIIPAKNKWDDKARLLGQALSDKYGSDVFWGREAEALALEMGLATGQYAHFEANQIWNRLRQLPMMEGVKGEMHYHTWRVKVE